MYGYAHDQKLKDLMLKSEPPQSCCSATLTQMISTRLVSMISGELRIMQTEPIRKTLGGRDKIYQKKAQEILLFKTGKALE